MIIVGIVFYFKHIIVYLKNNLKIKDCLIIIIGFLFGSSLFIIYNLYTKGETFKLIRFLYNGEITFAGVNNSNLIRNFKTRIYQLESVLNENFIPDEGFPYSNSLWYNEFIKKDYQMTAFD
jgi:hypothetical protein